MPINKIRSLADKRAASAESKLLSISLYKDDIIYAFKKEENALASQIFELYRDDLQPQVVFHSKSRKCSGPN